MSISPPFRCLFAKSATSSCLRRSIHTSNSLRARPKPKYPSIKASDMEASDFVASELGIVNRQIEFRQYTAAEKAALATQYTPAQIAVIEAGEAAVDPNDLAKQATIREDSMGLPYLDDLSEIHPVVDKPIRAPESNHDPNLRLKNKGELVKDIAHWLTNQSKEPEKLDWIKFSDDLRLTVGKEEAERNSPSSLSPELPVIQGLKPAEPERREEGSPLGNEIDPATRRLMKQTGYTWQEINTFRRKILVMRRVVNMTRMGRVQSLYFLSVAGNQKGLMGIGEGKSGISENARQKSMHDAIRNLKPIHRYEGRTTYGDLKAKVGGTELEIMTRTPGFGLRCQSIIYEMCKCAGIQDLAARVSRSRNKMNTAKATMKALLSQQLPEDLARARGKKLVDVRRVYYNGKV